jgi:hypothetical protein
MPQVFCWRRGDARASVNLAEYTRYALWLEFEVSASDRAWPGTSRSRCWCRKLVHMPHASGCKHDIWILSYVSCLLAYVWWSLRTYKDSQCAPSWATAVRDERCVAL